MPTFSSAQVTDPFLSQNELLAPMLAHIQAQEKLGNLDINRQRLGIEQDAATRDLAFGDYLKKSLPTDGTTGTTGAAAGGGGGSFLSALAQVESGDKNIVSGTDKDNQGLTLAQGGNPAEISQGHFQIHTGTWKDFAPQAGVDINKYPNAMSAPREIQAQVASVIPFKRFGPRTQTMMRQQFGDIDSNRTVGELAGLGPRSGSAAVAGPVAVVPPPATQQAGPLPVPPIPPGNPNAGPRLGLVPPSAVATTPPPAQTGQADDPNTAAVKQASAALLNMPEADAAAAYPAVVKELQARGFAMQAPPEYPGHAALQALVGGGDATTPEVDPSRQAMRLGGTAAAGPAAGQTTLPAVEQPNRLYSAGLPGVTINAPGNPLAPPPVQTAAAPATAPPGAARPPLEAPPAAPTRVIRREPLIQSGIFAGLTRTQAATIANTPGVKPATIMEQIATARHQNDVIRQGDATQAAIDEKENYDRWRVAEQTAYTRGQDAKRDAREEVAAKNAGMPPGYRLSDKGVATRIDGLPPDPAVAEAAKAAYEADQRKLPFQGNSEDAQNRNILLKGDPKSPEYHSAYASFATPKVQEGGIIINPKMEPYRFPQDADGNPITTYGKPNISIGPGDLPKLRAFETGATSLKAALDDFAKTSRDASFGERTATMLGQPTDLSGAWTNAALMAKGTALYELGVLSGPDMTVLRGALADPSTFMGRVTSNETIDKQVNRIKALIDTRLDQARQSYGGGMSTSGTTPSAAPAPKAERPPLSSFAR